MEDTGFATAVGVVVVGAVAVVKIFAVDVVAVTVLSAEIFSTVAVVDSSAPTVFVKISGVVVTVAAVLVVTAVVLAEIFNAVLIVVDVVLVAAVINIEIFAAVEVFNISVIFRISSAVVEISRPEAIIAAVVVVDNCPAVLEVDNCIEVVDVDNCLAVVDVNNCPAVVVVDNMAPVVIETPVVVVDISATDLLVVEKSAVVANSASVSFAKGGTTTIDMSTSFQVPFLSRNLNALSVIFEEVIIGLVSLKSPFNLLTPLASFV